MSRSRMGWTWLGRALALALTLSLGMLFGLGLAEETPEPEREGPYGFLVTEEWPEITDEETLTLSFYGEEGTSYTLHHKYRSIWRVPVTVELTEGDEGVFVVELGLGVNEFILREKGEPRNADAEDAVKYTVEYVDTLPPEPTATPEATEEETPEPTEEAAAEPTETPAATPEATEKPTPEPTEQATTEPTETPTATPEATEKPTLEPTSTPSPSPSPSPTPTPEPTQPPIIATLDSIPQEPEIPEKPVTPDTPPEQQTPAPEDTELDLVEDGPVVAETPAPTEEPFLDEGEHRTLSLWKKGSDVLSLQKQLNEHGYSVGKEDGVYGQRTERAVKRFQRDQGLEEDGVVGPLTREKLYEAGIELPLYFKAYEILPGGFERDLSLNKEGEDVARLQEALIALGYLEGEPDHVYGRKTRTAVIAFQRDHGIVPDGVAGPETLRALFPEEAVTPIPTETGTEPEETAAP